jgi:DNA repair protein RecN (Recombination protein N)
MLRRLSVRDLALVERADLDLVPGLCVLTGETGAGKSLLVAAIAALRGGRTSAELVRQDAESALIEGVFEGEAVDRLKPRLTAAGIAAEDELILRRTVTRDGRSRVLVNDQVVTLATLRELGTALIDLHGQHEHQALLDESQHARLLDESAGLEGAAAQVRGARAALRDACRRLAGAAAERARIESEAADLEAVAAEVDQVDPAPGEIETLKGERETLRHRDKITEVLRAAGRQLSEEEGSALERVGIVEGMLRHLETLDPALAPIAADLFEARLHVEEVVRAAERRLAELDLDPDRLQAVEDRLARLESLKRRHGSLEAAREAAAAARRDLSRLADASDDHERGAVAEAAVALARCGAKLSQARQAAANRLGRAVASELKALGFPGGAFQVALELRGEVPELKAPASGEPVPPAEALLALAEKLQAAIGEDGMESVRFLLAPNPGEGLHALQQIAAGGELARVMLALRTAFRGSGGAQVLVFDEVDSGVGGVVLDAVADRLAALAGGDRQVLCVTHQARIAARARLHVQVDKQTRAGRTSTRLQALDRRGRLAELERLLAGRRPGPRAAALAEELLARHQAGVV